MAATFPWGWWSFDLGKYRACDGTYALYKYDSLPPDLKQVIDANSGIETSALFGKITQDSDAIGLKAAKDRGNTIITIGAAETQEFIKQSSHVEEAWAADMTKRGYDGPRLLASAKSLIAKHSKSGA